MGECTYEGVDVTVKYLQSSRRAYMQLYESNMKSSTARNQDL
jgi:hypothetical protein